MWGATDLLDCLGAGHVISIHAPRVGSDCIHGILRLFCIISIHAPRVGSDENCSGSERSRCDFNPRSPCGERRPVRSQLLSRYYFNPRSPCGERLKQLLALVPVTAFQSTLPVWGATYSLIINNFFRDISIHAPRVGSDTTLYLNGTLSKISIHAPRVGSDPGYPPL